MLLGMQDFDFAKNSNFRKSNDYCPNLMTSFAQSYKRSYSVGANRRDFFTNFSKNSRDTKLPSILH